MVWDSTDYRVEEMMQTDIFRQVQTKADLQLAETRGQKYVDFGAGGKQQKTL